MKNIFFILLIIINISASAQLLSERQLLLEPVFTSISEALKNPEKAYRLDLSKQKLRELPDTLFSLYNLQELKLTKNKLQEISPKIANLSNLQKLDVSRNNLCVFPSSIGNLTNLTEIIANNNYIYTLPPEIGNLINLEILDLWSNVIDVFPKEIANLKDNLKVLDLRVVLMNEEKQQAIEDLLPNTKIHFSKSCNCH